MSILDRCLGPVTCEIMVLGHADDMHLRAQGCGKRPWTKDIPMFFVRPCPFDRTGSSDRTKDLTMLERSLTLAG